MIKKWSSPYINHFIQPDSLIPDPSNPQAWNRYSYVVNNPVRYTDPMGHMAWEGGGGCGTNCLENLNKKDNKKDEDMPCTKTDSTAECVWKRVKSGPDYISLNVPIPILYGLAGFDVIITRDHYNNWYIGGGVAGATPGFDFGFGWFLTDKRDEHHLESILSGHSFTISGGNLIGIGGNNVDPTFVHLENSHQTKPEDFALEAEITTPGGSAVYTYSTLLYDNGNPDSWLPDISRLWK